MNGNEEKEALLAGLALITLLLGFGLYAWGMGVGYGGEMILKEWRASIAQAQELERATIQSHQNGDWWINELPRPEGQGISAWQLMAGTTIGI